MKHLISTMAVTLVCVLCATAQDVITKHDGTDIQAKILEVNTDEIRYKRFDNLDGPTFVITKGEVLMIRYENGTNEVFTQQLQPVYQQQPARHQQQPAYQQPAQPVEYYTDYGAMGKVRPGMKYKHYKKFYDAGLYVPQPGDRYYPWVGGLCSWIVPGLGQMICGEVGRGLGFLLGGGLSAGVLMGTGTVLAYDYPILGLCLVGVGSLTLLTVDICAIVDGVRVAKRKNMYNQDMRRMGVSALDVKLQPYLSTVADGTMQIPVGGLSLAVTF